MKPRHFILILLALLASTHAFAETVKIDGIWYILASNGNTAEVTYNPNESYGYGAKNIPGSVIYNNVSYSVTSIGDRAFFNCSGLTSVTIPSSVTSIGDYAFFNCSSLTSITIPNSVTSIGEWAFSRCSGLTSVTIPGSVTSIGSSVFSNCSGLTSVTIPGSVTSFGSNVFQYCSNLISATILEGLTRIEPYTFYSCLNLISVIIPNSVTSIGFSAFQNCNSLASVIIPNSVTSIGACAFDGCSNLTSVTLGSGVTDIYARTFGKCNNLKNVFCYAEEVPHTAIDAFEDSHVEYATLHVPAASLEAYSTTAPWSSFGAIVAIEDNVKNIDFADPAVKVLCVANWDTNSDGELSEEEAAAVTSLGEVFRGNTTITSFNELQYFTGLTGISYDAFNKCSNLTSIIIPNGVTYIGDRAFSECSSLTSVAIPNSVESINWYAFNQCSSLISITIPESVTYIGNGVFQSCSSLTSVSIPNGVERIKENTFSNCSSLTSITIPNSVLNIEKWAFYKCNNLISIDIPNSVKNISEEAFRDCISLTSVIIPNSIKEINNLSFSGCSGLTSVSIPNSVTLIGAQAFENCSSLTSVTIPNSVYLIGSSAFSGCSGLTSVTIPNSMKYLLSNAFWGCSSLTSVVSEIEEPFAFENGAFGYISKNCVLTVPYGTRDAYIAAGWTEDVFKGGIVEALADEHEYRNGICTMHDECSEHFQRPEQDADGFYMLYNVGNVEWISQQVADNNNDLDCKLMNDIDFENVVNLHSPIGPNDERKYNATFDGQGFRIKNMIINRPNTERQGFFGDLRGNPNSRGEGTVIKNLIIDKSCSITGALRTGGITGTGQNNAKEIIIMNCVNEAAITTTANNAGGITGGSTSDHPIWKITNCVNTGTITALGNANGEKESAGISGWLGDNANTRVTNCFNLGMVDGLDPEGRGLFRQSNSSTIGINSYDLSFNEEAYQYKDHDFTVEDIANGRLAYSLNVLAGAIVYWQTLGEDEYPMPFSTSKQVYLRGKLMCDGTPIEGGTYTNDPVEPVRPPHEYEDGSFYCINCGAISEDFCELVDDFYQLNNEMDVCWFAEFVKAGHVEVNAKLNADLDFSDYPEFAGIADRDHGFKGIFDGGFHTISNMDMSWRAEEDWVGFINFLNGGATVKNLRGDNTCFIAAHSNAGFIGGSTAPGDIFLENIGFEGDVTCSVNGAGGVIGCNTGSQAIIHMTNCYSTGFIAGTNENGALSAWLGSSGAVITNCWSSAIVSGYQNTDKYLARFDNATFTNCYCVVPDPEIVPLQTTVVDYNDMENGSLCYNLNGDQENIAWYQTLGEDEFPTFMPGHLQVLFIDGSYVNGGVILINDETTSLSIASEENGKIVTFTHAFNGEWEALYLPFAIDYDDIKDDFDLAEIDGVVQNDQNNDGTPDITVLSIMGFKGQHTTPNKPYLIRAKNAGEQTIVFDDVTVYPTEELTFDCASFSTKYDFTGSYYTLNASALANRYVVQGGELVKGASSLAPCRWYMTATARNGAPLNLPNKIRIMSVEDVITGVEDLNANVKLRDSLFDLQGRKVTNPRKGIYIQNGKKVALK